ncbi:MAG: 5-methyltetrahydropteroyltriglutamate--homocysteine S-methyltransferase [Xanthobacteraceae bacterium]
MTWRYRPPFRADHVGSLLRPKELRDAREAHAAGKLDADALRELEDRCIRDVIAMQERVGLQAITDGEFRRFSFRDVLFECSTGFGARVETDFEFTHADGSKRRATPVPKVVGKVTRKKAISADDFKFLKPLTKGTAKVMLPAPDLAHWFAGDRIFSGVYADRSEYLADLAAVLREEIAELGRLGCNYVQIDEVPIPVMADPNVQAVIRKRGEDHIELVDAYVDAINDASRDRPAGMTICLHMCRGNEGSGLGSGGYDEIAERAFGRLQVDGYLLEYESPRSGDFEPLRYVPKDKQVLLGLISTKMRELEPKDELKRRVETASRFFDIDRLGLCPQCGFATIYRYDRLTIDDEERKLTHLVAVAREIWG